jgi:hypothetical protein
MGLARFDSYFDCYNGSVQMRPTGADGSDSGPAVSHLTMEDIPQYKTNGKTYLLYYYLYYYLGCWLPSSLIREDSDSYLCV